MDVDFDSVTKMATISRRQLFEIVHAASLISDIEAACKLCTDHVLNLYSVNQSAFTEGILSRTCSQLKDFLYELKRRWGFSKRTVTTFLRKNKSWLGKDIIFSVEISNVLTIKNKEDTSSTSAKSLQDPEETSEDPRVGRPTKEWGDLSERSRKRKAQEMLSHTEPTELLYAASQGAYKKNRDLKYVLKFAMMTPSRPTKIRKLISKPVEEAEPFTADEALSLFVESDMTKRSYQMVRSAAKRKRANIYPPYNKIREAKNQCYPVDISVEEDSAKVPLQSLLDHTALRIIEEKKETITEVVENLENEPFSCNLICKWGFDGSSGQSQYKQKFNTTDQSDASLFCTTLVPLQLKFGERVLWQNPVPSSTRFCRPIHLQFKQETTELSQEEYHRISEEIQQLHPMDVTLDIDYEMDAANPRKDNMQVTYDLQLTMVDQKVINALTETKSSMRCYICGATPKLFNNIDNLPGATEENFKYGLSPLHKWIRCFEMLLHISYRIPVKQWRVSSEQDKIKVASRKKEVHDRFHAELGLKVDEPKQGSGNTNDGNTARRAFKDEEIFAEICGLDKSLVHRIHMVLIAISCKLPLDPEKFGIFCRNTAELLIKLYPWFRMPVSVHILLMHGATVLASSLLPIGMMSEEAQEARNKDNKSFRLKHARKTSRKDTMSDVFHRLMVTGDIVISSRLMKEPPARPLPTEVKNMLKYPSLHVNDSDASESEES